jgi:hypothetical protein
MQFPVNSFLPRILYCGVNLFLLVLALANLCMILSGSTSECDADPDSIDDTNRYGDRFSVLLTLLTTQLCQLLLVGPHWLCKRLWNTGTSLLYSMFILFFAACLL